jgi:hypothetical protein
VFNIEDKELKQLTKNLQQTFKYAYPDTVRRTVNNMAFLASKAIKDKIKETFTVRSQNFVKNTIRYKGTKSKIVDEMITYAGQADNTFGKPSEQFKRQEFGETIKAKNKHIVKPTKAARGGSYKRLVRAENLMSKIKVKRISDLVEHPAKSEFKEFRQAIGYIKHNPDETVYFLPSGESYYGINGIVKLSADNKSKFLYSLKGKEQPLKPQPVIKPTGEAIGAKGVELYKKEAQDRIEKELARGLK